MQVNNTQDYLTQYKRRVISKSIAVASPPQKRRTNAMYTSVLANNGDQFNRFVGGAGRNNFYCASLGTVFTSLCCKPQNVNSGGTLSYTPAYTGIQPYLV
jgi:hypothetical protein